MLRSCKYIECKFKSKLKLVFNLQFKFHLGALFFRNVCVWSSFSKESSQNHYRIHGFVV